MILRNGPLPNDPSREAPERVRKTHKDPETTHRLTKLPIDSKLKMNYEKQMRNANRRERAIVGADNTNHISTESNAGSQLIHLAGWPTSANSSEQDPETPTTRHPILPQLNLSNVSAQTTN
ncbi:hypothetical protein GGU11DRAFT_747552 [Lentinula aff. detonsa]|nr:hypothetical protein GGU11DRAFT_747552 [Lentinula aff. detonsa]